MNEVMEREPAKDVAVAQEPANMLQVIAQAAQDPNVEVEKMRALLEMKKEVDAISAEKAFNGAMNAAQIEMGPVVRDAENSHTKSKYARLETISDAIDPIILKHGFAVTYGTYKSELQGHYGVKCIVRHTDGHTDITEADIPADAAGAKGNANKNATQAFGSTMSYGRRYLKVMAFDVKIKGEDDDGNAAANNDVLSEEQVFVLRNLLKKVGGDEAKFLQGIGVGALEDVYANKFDDCVRIIGEKAL